MPSLWIVVFAVSYAKRKRMHQLTFLHLLNALLLSFVDPVVNIYGGCYQETLQFHGLLPLTRQISQNFCLWTSHKTVWLFECI